jgi:hypothetical protein
MQSLLSFITKKYKRKKFYGQSINNEHSFLHLLGLVLGLEKARLENERTLGNKGDGSTEIKEISEREEPTQEAQGLGTGLKRTSTANSVPTASPQVEVFLDEVAERLLTELDKSKNQPEMTKAKEI